MAVEFLTAETGTVAIIDYFGEIGNGLTWEQAFSSAFNESPAEFYQRFAQYRLELTPLGVDQTAVQYPGYTVDGFGDFVAEQIPSAVAVDEQALFTGWTVPGIACELAITDGSTVLAVREARAGLIGDVFWLWTPSDELESTTIYAEMDCGGVPASIEIPAT